MTVNELAEKYSLTKLAVPDGDRVIDGGYTGDLLSWVMGRAESGNVWVTIMSNINIVAVAALADTSCIVLAEGVTLEDSIIEAAKEKNVNILSTPMSAFEAISAFSKDI